MNPRAASGYTTINVTRETKKLIDQLARSDWSKVSLDDLLYKLAMAELERRRAAENSMERTRSR